MPYAATNLDLARQAAEKAVQLHGKVHPRVLTALENYANLLHAAGDAQRANKISEQAKILRKVLDERYSQAKIQDTDSVVRSFVDSQSKTIINLVSFIDDGRKIYPYAVSESPLWMTLFGLITYLHMSGGGLTKPQYDLLEAVRKKIDLHLPYADSSPLQTFLFNGIPFEKVLKRLTGLTIAFGVGNDKTRLPEFYLLGFLRALDAIFLTSRALVLAQFLECLAETLLLKLQPANDAALLLFTDVQDELFQQLNCRRQPPAMYIPSSTDLSIQINETIREIAGPLAQCMAEIARHANGEQVALPEVMMRQELRSYFVKLLAIDGHIDEAETRLACDLAPVFLLPGSTDFQVFHRKLCDLVGKDVPPLADALPMYVQVLDLYDNEMKTQYGADARRMYFALAEAALGADDKVTDIEQKWLQRFKTTLDPSGTLFNARTVKSGTSSKAQKQSLEEHIEELQSLIGMNSVKQDVGSLVNFLKVQQLRSEKGLPTSAVSRHLVFYGNPGTGKTTVARILAQIYKSMGLLSSGHLVEVDRAGLVAPYVGQTALKVKERIEEARGGILFIDEAYALVQDGQNDSYGQEAIDCLVKSIEDNREDLIVIVAGYPEKMGRFLSANPGLRSRFNKFFSFADYLPEQLFEIFQLFCSKGGYSLNKEASSLVLELLTELHSARGSDFGNARDVRNLFETSLANQADRIVGLANAQDEHLEEITTADVSPLLATISAKR